MQEDKFQECASILVTSTDKVAPVPKHHTVKVCGGDMQVTFHELYTSPLYWGEWTAPAALTTKEH